MTPYTIALAGKAYLTKANCIGKIQQTTGNNYFSAARIVFSKQSSTLLIFRSLGASNLLFKQLPFPYSVANQPLLKRRDKKNGSGSFPGIYNNIKIVRVLLHSATIGFRKALHALRQLTLDTAYLTTSFDVIVSKSFSGRGNYKLIPVLLTAR